MKEEYNVERVVPLVLNVSDIHPWTSYNDFYPLNVLSNSAGTIQNGVADVTWNVNMETLLGDLYHKYEYFNLEVVQFTTIPYTGGGLFTSKPFQITGSGEYTNLNVYMSGLQFVRSTYSQKRDTELQYAHLCNISTRFRLPDNAPNFGNFRGDEFMYETQKGYVDHNLCFKKEKNVRINIRFGSLTSGLDYVPSSIFVDQDALMFHFIIKFNIIPFK